MGGTGWGLSGTCGQYFFSYSDVAPLTVTIYRLIFSGLLLIIINLIRHPQGMLDIFKDWKTVVHLVVYGVFGVGLCQLSYLSAISYSNSGTATVLQSSGIILVFIIVSIMQRKAPKGFEYLCLALVMGGVFLLATHGNITYLYLSKEGLFWGAAAAVALYTLLPGKLTARFETSLVLGYSMLIAHRRPCPLCRLRKCPHSYRYPSCNSAVHSIYRHIRNRHWFRLLSDGSGSLRGKEGAHNFKY